MFRRIYNISALASAVLAVITAGWAGLAITSAGGRLSWDVWLRHPSFVLSGGQIISSNSGYTFCTERSGVTLYYIGLTPVMSPEVGSDGRPLFGGFAPTIEVVLVVPFRRMITIAAAATPLPAIWLLVLFRPRTRRGFAVISTINSGMNRAATAARPVWRLRA